MAVTALGLVVGLAALLLRLWRQEKVGLAEAESNRVALAALLADQADDGIPAARVAATLADWREELRHQRSRALEEYNFAELAQGLTNPSSVASGTPEARVRAQVLQRIRTLFGWLPTALQQYNPEKPLVVRELTGTAPTEIKIYAGPDRRLYYTEGGAIRQRNWNDLQPSVLAAIIVGTMREARPVPAREVMLGALAFGLLYNLPELSETLKQIGAQPQKR
jgi:hypothetical protein